MNIPGMRLSLLIGNFIVSKYRCRKNQMNINREMDRESAMETKHNTTGTQLDFTAIQASTSIGSIFLPMLNDIGTRFRENNFTIN